MPVDRMPVDLIVGRSDALKRLGNFFKTNIFIVAYTLVSPKKYFAKNLELCGSRNLLFGIAVSAAKLQFGEFLSGFVTPNS